MLKTKKLKYIMFLLMLTICISFVFGDSEPLVNTWNGYVTIDANTSTNGAVVGVFVNDDNTLNVVVGDCDCPVGFYVADVPCADGDDITFKVYGVNVTHATQTCIVGRTTYVELNLTMSKLASGATCTYAAACNTTYCCDSSYTNCNGDCTGTCLDSCTAPTTTGGGGGGGTTALTTVISFTTAGVDVSLAKNNIAKFAFDSAYHTIKVIKIGADYVTLEIASDPVTITLNLLESKKLDLNNDNYYDLYIKLNEIKSSKAYLEVKYIHEIITPVVTPPAEEEEEEEVPEEEPEETPEEEPEEEVPPVKPIEEPPVNLTGIWILIVIIAIGLIAYLIYKKKKEY